MKTFRDYFAHPSTSRNQEKTNYVKENGADLALTARPLSDWEAEAANQLSVKFSETLKVQWFFDGVQQIISQG